MKVLRKVSEIAHSEMKSKGHLDPAGPISEASKATYREIGYVTHVMRTELGNPE